MLASFPARPFGIPVSGPFNASIALTLDPTNRILFRTETAKVCVTGRGCRTLSTNVNFQLPFDVDGSWVPSLTVATSNSVVRGTATALPARTRAWIAATDAAPVG